MDLQFITSTNVIYINIDSQQFLSEAKYIFQFFFTVLGIKKIQIVSQVESLSGIIVYYGREHRSASRGKFIIHIADADYYKKYDSPQVSSGIKCTKSMQNLPINLKYIFSKKLAGLKDVWYKEEKNKSSLVTSSENAIHCNIDIVSSSFYLLNLENERLCDGRDNLDRFQKSHAKMGNAVYENPIVDQLLLLFDAFLKRAHGSVNHTHLYSIWPQNCTFALALSHDVDRLRTWTYSKAKRVLKESGGNKEFDRLLKKSVEVFYSISLKNNWSGNFAYITQLEKRYRANSTFFFASKRRSLQDPKYKLGWKRIRSGFGKIIQNNSQIGLHGTFLSFKNGDFLNEEKTILEKSINTNIKGFRQHYLRFDIQGTFDAIAHARFKYDSTLGFSDDLGYRCGTSLPYFPFNPREKNAYSFLEIPLILMDTVLFLESKLNLSSVKAWEFVEKHLKLAHESGFCLTINWHNNNINTADVFGYAKLYEKILEWAFEKNAWICSLDDLYDWWIQKIELLRMEEN